ncbi:hypothetical protein NON00_23760 [Roseomonas sp. GC11]|uniref:DVU3141 family protein n=1 Tax=Roseomonas sp. GC11 TaxID=2950546 RepID=UPI002109A205|nr:DVU3141 family protein [Roseomonas sp. GC11]MCQ4162921.1 hypothetical protein [Roseomonas sp. GC11]
MGWVFRALARGPLALILLALAGCGSVPGGWGRGSVPPAQASLPPPRPADPLAAFAAEAQPGQEAVLAPAAGQAPVPVRVARAYNAGSGRLCKELTVGGGAQARPQLYCGDAQGWEAARPLLRGGAVPRP